METATGESTVCGLHRFAGKSASRRSPRGSGKRSGLLTLSLTVLLTKVTGWHYREGARQGHVGRLQFQLPFGRVRS